MNATAEIVNLFEKRGASAYLGEPVSQLEHARQAAFYAEQEKASRYLVVAALVHDIGHLLEDVPKEITERGVDARHEEIGEAWLKKRFGPEVYEPVRLHVAAKRYLCATDRSYLDQLSPASVLSLKLQGGPMSQAELTEFEKQRLFREAVQLRRWDDLAKVKGAKVPALEHYLEDIEKVLLPAG